MNKVTKRADQLLNLLEETTISEETPTRNVSAVPPNTSHLQTNPIINGSQETLSYMNNTNTAVNIIPETQSPSNLNHNHEQNLASLPPLNYHTHSHSRHSSIASTGTNFSLGRSITRDQLKPKHSAAQNRDRSNSISANSESPSRRSLVNSNFTNLSQQRSQSQNLYQNRQPPPYHQAKRRSMHRSLSNRNTSYTNTDSSTINFSDTDLSSLSTPSITKSTRTTPKTSLHRENSREPMQENLQNNNNNNQNSHPRYQSTAVFDRPFANSNQPVASPPQNQEEIIELQSMHSNISATLSRNSKGTRIKISNNFKNQNPANTNPEYNEFSVNNDSDKVSTNITGHRSNIARPLHQKMNLQEKYISYTNQQMQQNQIPHPDTHYNSVQRPYSSLAHRQHGTKFKKPSSNDKGVGTFHNAYHRISYNSFEPFNIDQYQTISKSNPDMTTINQMIEEEEFRNKKHMFYSSSNQRNSNDFKSNSNSNLHPPGNNNFLTRRNSERGRNYTRNYHRYNRKLREKQRDYNLELRRHKLENELKVQQLARQIKQAEELQDERYKRLEDAKERILCAEERVENSIKVRLNLEEKLIQERQRNLSQSLQGNKEIKLLMKKIKDLEKKTTRERRDVIDLNENIATLNAELEASRKSTVKLEKSKLDLESQLNEATLDLSRERRISRSLSAEKLKLQQELEDMVKDKSLQATKEQKKIDELSQEVELLNEHLATEKRQSNQEKRKSVSLSKEYEALQKQLTRERERSQRLQSENTELAGQKKRLESVLRTERLDASTKESCLKRNTMNIQRELDDQKEEISKTRRNFERIIERNMSEQANSLAAANLVNLQNQISKNFPLPIASTVSVASHSRQSSYLSALQKENERLRAENCTVRSEVISLKNHTPSLIAVDRSRNNSDAIDPNNLANLNHLGIAITSNNSGMVMDRNGNFLGHAPTPPVNISHNLSHLANTSFGITSKSQATDSECPPNNNMPPVMNHEARQKEFLQMTQHLSHRENRNLNRDQNSNHSNQFNNEPNNNNNLNNANRNRHPSSNSAHSPTKHITDRTTVIPSVTFGSPVSHKFRHDSYGQTSNFTTSDNGLINESTISDEIPLIAEEDHEDENPNNNSVILRQQREAAKENLAKNLLDRNNSQNTSIRSVKERKPSTQFLKNQRESHHSGSTSTSTTSGTITSLDVSDNCPTMTMSYGNTRYSPDSPDRIKKQSTQSSHHQNQNNAEIHPDRQYQSSNPTGTATGTIHTTYLTTPSPTSTRKTYRSGESSVNYAELEQQANEAITKHAKRRLLKSSMKFKHY